MPREFEKRLAIWVAVIGLGAACLGIPRAAAGPVPEPAPGKADKLPVPLASQPPEDYPVAAGGKEDRAPVRPETTKRKGAADDRLTPDQLDPDRLRPE